MKNLRLQIKLTCLLATAFAAAAFAVDPPPDGGYPNNNTAEGTDALFSLTTGANNTAIGFGRFIITPRRAATRQSVITHS